MALSAGDAFAGIYRMHQGSSIVGSVMRRAWLDWKTRSFIWLKKKKIKHLSNKRRTTARIPAPMTL
jgi:Fe-S cluster biosynthesis and repair protein YggX